MPHAVITASRPRLFMRNARTQRFPPLPPSHQRDGRSVTGRAIDRFSPSVFCFRVIRDQRWIHGPEVTHEYGLDLQGRHNLMIRLLNSHTCHNCIVWSCQRANKRQLAVMFAMACVILIWLRVSASNPAPCLFAPAVRPQSTLHYP